MKGFQFRLEPVLRLRRHGLDRRRLDLARARVSLRAATRLRGALADALRAAQERRAVRMAEGLRAGELRELQHGVEHLLGEVSRADAAVRAAESAATQALAGVTEARRSVRALEILREKALAEHRRELERREQAELDEVAGRSHPVGASW
jgi:flagellar FliJ protein